MALDRELETYQKELPSLLQDEGKYVLICQDEIGGTYDTYEDAIKFGYEKYNLKRFLVKKIQAVEQVQYFTRHIDPCRI